MAKRWSRDAGIVIALYVWVGGVISLLGWAGDLPRLTDWFNHGVSIQPNAALAAMASGGGLLLIHIRRARWALPLGLLVCGIGATALFQNLTHISMPWLNRPLMFGREWGQNAVVDPGRMGIPGSVCWTLIGATLVLLALRGPRRWRLISVMAVVTAAISFTSVISYFYGADQLYMMPRITVIAFQTATFILAVSLGLITCSPERQPMRMLLDKGGAGILARRAMPLLLVLPLILGWLRITGEAAGMFDTVFGTALRTSLEIILLITLMWWALRSVSTYERKFEESRERLSGVLGSIGDALITIDKNWHITYVNDEAAQRFGRSPKALVGVLLAEVEPEAAADVALRAKLQQAMNERQRVEFEIYCPRHQSWFRNRAYPTGDGGLTIYSQNITEAKNAAETLRLRDELLRTVTENAHVGMVAVDEDHHYLYANRAYVRMMAIEEQDLVGRHVKDVLPELYETHIRWRLEQIFRGERVSYTLSHGGRYLQVTYQLHTGSMGKKSVIVSVVDITEQTKSEQALRVADRRKDEFLATLAHELRNPLAPVRNAVEIQKSPLSTDEEWIWSRDLIDRQVAHMSRLLDDLLDVSRITSNKLTLRRETLDLVVILRQAAETVRPMFRAADHTLELLLPAEPVLVDCDAVRLGQVFTNLLTNAAKYTNNGGRIEVQLVVTEDCAEVFVRDNGIGISSDRLATIFEMFHQVDSALDRTQGGLGIGLNLVKRLVGLHGGTVEAQSEGVGFGSTFIVRLPVRTSGALSAELPPKDIAGVTRKSRILVVDDNVDGARSLARLLEIEGHEVALAHDGESAIARAQAWTPEVILLDLGMPKMNGYETCRRLRSSQGATRKIIVALTGFGQEDDRKRTAAAGFDAHLVKPLDVSALRRLLAQLPSVALV